MARNFQRDTISQLSPPPPSDQEEERLRRIREGKRRAQSTQQGNEPMEDEEEAVETIGMRTAKRRRHEDKQRQNQERQDEEQEEEEEEAPPPKRARKDLAKRDGADSAGNRGRDTAGRGRGGGRSGAAKGTARNINAGGAGANLDQANAILEQLRALTTQVGGMRDDIQGLTGRVEALETQRQERPRTQRNMNAAAGPSRRPDRQQTGAAGTDRDGRDNREERFIRTGNESRKFDSQNKPFKVRHWRYDYVDVTNFPPDGPNKKEMINDLYRKGMKKSQASGSYVFQPGSDLSVVRDNIPIPLDESISREGTPERDPPAYIEPGNPQYFIVPQTNWAEAALYATKLKIGTDATNIDAGLSAQLEKNVKFIFKVDSPDVDLNRFGMYPRIDIETCIVYHPINSDRNGQMDTHQTPKTIQDRHRGNNIGR
jgi:hypothetical protein